MANSSIRAAFERLWQHVISAISKSEEKTKTYVDNIADDKLGVNETATAAINVTKNINGKAISSIFESDGTTIKHATYSSYADTSSALDDTFTGNIVLMTLDSATYLGDIPSDADIMVCTTDEEGNPIIANQYAGRVKVGSSRQADKATTADKATADANGANIASTYETKAGASNKLTEAKRYADGIKNDLLNGAGPAYDTLKELGALIDENQDAIDALETVATNKLDKTGGAVSGNFEIGKDNVFNSPSAMLAVGSGNQVGVKGYYYSDLDFTAKTITLLNYEQSSPEAILADATLVSNINAGTVALKLLTTQEGTYSYENASGTTVTQTIASNVYQDITLAELNNFNCTVEYRLLIDHKTTKPCNYQVGDIISLVGGYLSKKFENCSTVTAVNGNVITIDAFPEDSQWNDPDTGSYMAPPHFYTNYIHCVDRPDVGLVSFGDFAFAIGEQNNAANYCGFAGGYNNQVIGMYGAALGHSNKAAYAAFAAGRENEALGWYSFLAGRGNATKAKWSAGFGGNNTLDTTAEHALVGGYRNTVSGAKGLTVGENNIVDSTGDKNIIGGNTNTVSGYNSIVGGMNHNVSKQNNIVGGNGNTVKNYNNIVGGNANTVGGTQNLVVGKENTVSGSATITGGLGLKNPNSYSLVTGQYNAEDATALVIVGNGAADDTRSNAYTLDADGNGVYAGEVYSGSQTDDNKLIKKSEIPAGANVGRIITNDKGAVLGEIFNDYNNNTANGAYSHAEGGTTHANGAYSHAEGWNAHANGAYSHAEGWNTLASSRFSHVQGKLNIEDTQEKYAHIVGNGYQYTSDGSPAVYRSNAHTLDWDGNAWFAGNISNGVNNNILENATNSLIIGDKNKVQLQVDDSETTDIDESTLNTELKQIGFIGQENVASGSKNSLLVGVKCRTDTVNCDKSSLTNYTAFAGGYNSRVHHSAGFAWGINNEVFHKASGAMGNFLYTSAPNQFVTGGYNAYDTAADSSLASARFVVGSGSSNTNRKNCFVTGASKTTINSTDIELNGKVTINGEALADYAYKKVYTLTYNGGDIANELDNNSDAPIMAKIDGETIYGGDGSGMIGIDNIVFELPAIIWTPYAPSYSSAVAALEGECYLSKYETITINLAHPAMYEYGEYVGYALDKIDITRTELGADTQKYTILAYDSNNKANTYVQFTGFAGTCSKSVTKLF